MAEDQEQGWGELDEASFRNSVGHIIFHQLPDNSFNQWFEALQRLRSIVADEVASGVSSWVSTLASHLPKNSRADAQKLVDTISDALDSVGLAIRHPKSGAPMRLTLASTPPNAGESWLQLESYSDPGSVRAERLPFPCLNLGVRRLDTDRSASRRGPNL